MHDNIARFGGDPANVIIFGESGGGAKTSCLYAMPSAAPYFNKASIESIIHAWRSADKKTKGGKKPTSTLEEEIESLRRQLCQTEMERDILKKLSPFSTVRRSGRMT